MLKTTSLLSGSLLTLTLLLGGCGDDPVTPSTPTTPTNTVPPTVTALDPTSGSADGGSQTVITGTGFTNATGILFGSTPAPIFTVASDTSITVVVPAGAAGVVPILVKATEGTSFSSSTGQFTWLPNPLLDLSIEATSVKAGQRLRGSVTVTYPAPDAGIRLPLTWTSTPSRSNAVLVPTTVQVGAGQTTGTFEITTFYQSTAEQLTLVSDHGGVGKSVTFTLTP